MRPLNTLVCASLFVPGVVRGQQTGVPREVRIAGIQGAVTVSADNDSTWVTANTPTGTFRIGGDSLMMATWADQAAALPAPNGPRRATNYNAIRLVMPDSLVADTLAMQLVRASRDAAASYVLIASNGAWRGAVGMKSESARQLLAALRGMQPAGAAPAPPVVYADSQVDGHFQAVYRIPAIYPTLLWATHVPGSALLEFVVDTAGRVDPTSVRAVRTTNSLFARAARNAVVQYRYSAATIHGEPVPVRLRETFTFSPDAKTETSIPPSARAVARISEVQGDSGTVSIELTTAGPMRVSVHRGDATVTVQSDSASVARFADRVATSDSALSLEDTQGGIGTVTVTRLGRDTLAAYRVDATDAPTAMAITLDAASTRTLMTLLHGPPATFSLWPPNATHGLIYYDFQVQRQASSKPGSRAPEYPRGALMAGIEGQVLAQFVVDSTGRARVDTFRALRSSDPMFTQAVLDALPKMRFNPATIDGRPVNQLVQQPFIFNTAIPPAR